MDLQYDHTFTPTDKFDELLIKAMKQKTHQKLRVEKSLKNSNVSISCSYTTTFNHIFYN